MNAYNVNFLAFCLAPLNSDKNGTRLATSRAIEAVQLFGPKSGASLSSVVLDGLVPEFFPYC